MFLNAGRQAGLLALDFPRPSPSSSGTHKAPSLVSRWKVAAAQDADEEHAKAEAGTKQTLKRVWWCGARGSGEKGRRVSRGDWLQNVSFKGSRQEERIPGKPSHSKGAGGSPHFFPHPSREKMEWNRSRGILCP